MIVLLISSIYQEFISRLVENDRRVSTQRARYRYREYQPVHVEMCQHHR